MTASKLIGKLLKFKGFRCVGLAFRCDRRLEVLVTRRNRVAEP